MQNNIVKMTRSAILYMEYISNNLYEFIDSIGSKINNKKNDKECNIIYGVY
jgi:hypothetical protein